MLLGHGRTVLRQAASRSGSMQTVRFMSSSAVEAEASGGQMENTYAKALYMAANKSSAFDKVAGDAEMLLNYRAQSTEFRNFLGNPVISRAFKQAVFTDTISPKMGLNEVTSEFLKVVASNGRSGAIGSILATFIKTYASEKDSAAGIVKVAQPASEWEKANIEKTLISLFFPDGSKTSLDLKFELEPSLIGGLTAEIDERFIDMSVKQEALQVEEMVKAS